MLAGLAMVVAGCGPGVGGTGTGSDPTPVSQLDPEAASACTAPFAALLGCAGTAANGGAAPVPAPQVILADGHPSARDQAIHAEPVLRVELRCEGWRFEGQWGRTEALGLRWYGTLTRSDGSAAPASMAWQTEGNPVTGVRVSLFDDNDRLLAGPRSLRVVPGQTTAAACP